MGERLRGGEGRSHLSFAMDFVRIGVSQKLIEQEVCGFQRKDIPGGKERRQALLPVVVTAFDFTFGLWSRSKAQGDGIKVQGGAQLGENLWRVGKEEEMIADVKSQREAVSEGRRGKESRGCRGAPACPANPVESSAE